MNGMKREAVEAWRAEAMRRLDVDSRPIEVDPAELRDICDLALVGAIVRDSTVMAEQLGTAGGGEVSEVHDLLEALASALEALSCRSCERRGQPRVECSVCGRFKTPFGRSAPMESYDCDSSCAGYHIAPVPDHLWPNERWGDALPCVHGPKGAARG